MPIPLGNSSRPNVKLPFIGSGIEVSIIGTRNKPWMEFGSNPPRPKLGDDGKPRKQLVVTGIVVSQSNANAGSQDAPREPAVGEVVDLWLHGHVWGSWIEAEKAYRTAGFEMAVGDIVLWHYTHDEPGQNAQPKKVRTSTFRKPRPDEQWVVPMAEQQYYALDFDKPDTSEPAQDQGPGPFDQGAPGYGNQPQYGQQAPPQQPQQAPQPQYGQQAPPQQPQQPQQAPQPQYAQQAPQAPQQPQPAAPSPGYGPPPQVPQQPAGAPNYGGDSGPGF